MKLFTRSTRPLPFLLVLLIGYCLTAHAISPPEETGLIFTKNRNGKEHIFYTGEPVYCVTRLDPRRIVRGTIDTIAATYILISGDRVPLDDIDRMEKRGTKFDDVTTALFFGSLGFLIIGGMTGFVNALAGGSGGGGILVFLLLIFLGSFVAKIIRSATMKKVKRVPKKYTISVETRTRE